MSWHYSQALVEDFLERGCLDGDVYAELKLIRTAEKSCFGDKKKAISIPSPYGTTRVRSMADLGLKKWMSLLPDFHANPSARLGSDLVKTIPATCGRTHSGSYARYDRDSCCWRTYQLSLLENTSEKLSGSFRRAGIACAGELYPQPSWERRISATASGLWPTVRSTDGERGGRGDLIQAVRGNPNSHYKMWPTPKASPSGPDFARTNREGSGGDDLATAVVRGGTVTPPTYPTPTSSMMTMGDMEQARFSGNSPDRPSYRQANRTTEGGALNPPWVAWLMGWPIGWTDLEPLATDKFQQWLRQHGCL